MQNIKSTVALKIKKTADQIEPQCNNMENIITLVRSRHGHAPIKVKKHSVYLD